MSILDSLDHGKKQELYKNSFKPGDVFLKKFDEAEHDKFFIIAGISEHKIYICSVFINSKIHPSVLNKPNICKLHIPLLKSRNPFLAYDSFVNCSYPISLTSEQITKAIVENKCKIIGEIHSLDLVIVRKTLIESGLLSEEEIIMFFKNDLNI